MYKLAIGGVIHPQGFFVPNNPLNADWQDYQRWLTAGNTPLPADVPTAEQIAREAEINTANPTARTYFLANPAAVAFVRLTPAEQATQIDSYTLAQLKTVVKFLAIATSALIKKELL